MNQHTEHTLSALRSILALLFALIITGILIFIIPVFGVRSTVLVVALDPSKNAAIDHVVENTIVVGDSVVRETYDTPRDRTISRVRTSDAIAFTVYGRNRDALYAQNELLVATVLERANRYYDATTGIGFERLSRGYEVVRYWYVFAILIVAVLIGTYLASLATLGIRAFLLAREVRVTDDVEDGRAREVHWNRVQQHGTSDIPPQHYFATEPAEDISDHEGSVLSDSAKYPEALSSNEVFYEDDFVQEIPAETRTKEEDVPEYRFADLDHNIATVDDPQERVSDEVDGAKQKRPTAFSLPSIPLPRQKNSDRVNDLVDEATPEEGSSEAGQGDVAKSEKNATDSTASAGLAFGAPGNLPIVEMPQADDLVDSSDSNTAKSESPANEKRDEPSDDELKKRLNRLLKGEL